MKNLIIFCSIILMLFLTGCKDDEFTKGNILYDCGIPTMESIDNCEMLAYNGSEPININNDDINFLEYYTYKEDYPAVKIHELYIFPGITTLRIKSGVVSETLKILENGDIVVYFEDSGYKTYTADTKYLATREKIDKISGITKKVDDSSKPSPGTELPDGTYLYISSNISKNKTFEFKDEKGNILLNQNDIVRVFAKFSEYNNYYIELILTEEGQEKFTKATEENTGKTITISADNEILSAPTVQAVIESNSIIVANNTQSYDEMITLFYKITG